MNRCETIRRQLIELVYEELAQAEQAQLDEHLATCAGCRDHLAQLVSTRERLGSGEFATPVRLSASLTLSLAKQQELRQRTTMRRALGTAAAAAALVMIAASFGVRIEANSQQVRIYWRTALPVAESPTVEKIEFVEGPTTYRRLLRDWDTPPPQTQSAGNTVATAPTPLGKSSYLQLRQELGEL